MKGHAGRTIMVSAGALVVEWQLGDEAKLELRLNLSREPARSSQPPGGTLLFCEPPDAASTHAKGELPPESAAYFLSG